MIQFWWSRVLQQPDVSELDYFCRMDTDSMLLAPVPFDIFSVMQSDKLLYGYKHQDFDVPEVVDGMWSFVSAYLVKQQNTHQVAVSNGWKMPPEAERTITNFPTYFNNFEVGKKLQLAA